MLNMYSNLHIQEDQKLQKGCILDQQHYYKAKTSTKVRNFYLVGHFVDQQFPRSHLNNYWNICTENGFTPTMPKDWVAPVGWVPPNEHDMGNP